MFRERSKYEREGLVRGGEVKGSSGGWGKTCWDAPPYIGFRGSANWLSGY